jgi:hypothetical protein
LGVAFSDGFAAVHDFASVVNKPSPMLEPLRDETYFARVFLEFGAPTWPNGFDIGPEGCGASWITDAALLGSVA